METDGNHPLFGKTAVVGRCGSTDHLEGTIIRLLKNVIHAVLHPRCVLSFSSPTVEEENRLAEALQLYHSLRVSASWDGTAAMALELLAFIARRAGRHLASCKEEDAVIVVQAQKTATEVLSILQPHNGLARRFSQHTILAVCTEMAMQAFFTMTSIPSLIAAKALPFPSHFMV